MAESKSAALPLGYAPIVTSAGAWLGVARARGAGGPRCPGELVNYHHNADKAEISWVDASRAAGLIGPEDLNRPRPAAGRSSGRRPPTTMWARSGRGGRQRQGRRSDRRTGQNRSRRCRSCARAALPAAGRDARAPPRSRGRGSPPPRSDRCGGPASTAGEAGGITRHRSRSGRYAAKAPRRAAKTSAVGSVRRGLARTMPAGGNPAAGSIRSPMPPTQTGRAARQAGVSAPSFSASAARASGPSGRCHIRVERAQRRRCIARPAADPRGGRQPLVEMQCGPEGRGPRRCRSASSAKSRAARITRLSSPSAGEGARLGPADRQGQGRRPARRSPDRRYRRRQ